MKKRIKIILLCVATVYALSALIFEFIESRKDGCFIVGQKAPMIIAHVASMYLFSENTMLAFGGVAPYAPAMLEVDVMLTRDSILFTHHNPTLEQRSNGEGRVADYTLEKLHQFNFVHFFKDTDGNYSYRDSPIPPVMFEEVLTNYGQRFLFCVEMKDYGTGLGRRAAREFWRLLLKYGMEECSIDDEILKYFRRISDNRVYVSSAKRQMKCFVIMLSLFAANFFTGKSDTLQIPVERDGFRPDKKRMIRAAHRKNVQFITG